MLCYTVLIRGFTLRYVEYNGDQLSALALGTVQLGLDYGIANDKGKPTQDLANGIIQYIHSQGINCLDTAQAYGTSEEVVGIATSGLSNINIVSKVKSDVFKEQLFESLDESLKKLYKKHLYALLLHDSKLLYHWSDEDSQQVKRLKNNALIKYFGVSIYSSEDFSLAIENDDIDVIQIPYNLFDQRALNEKWFEKAQKSNKLIFIRSVFLQGLLLMDADQAQKRVEGTGTLIEKIDTLCHQLNLSKQELLLSFVLSTCKNSIMLFGCETLEQAKENIETFNSLKLLNEKILLEINKSFSQINENIYNPGKW